MNEYQEIFTAEQFRAQAVELSQAVAELQRRDSQRIDPQDPFGNETEFHEYQSDYAHIVPQIRIPGCRIPLKPNSREKSRIRRNNNIVGGFLLGHLVLSNVLAIGLEMVIMFCIRLVDSMSVAELPVNYEDLLTDYFWDSSSMMAMNLLTYGIMNVLVALLGCRAAKIPIPNLFRTHDFTAMHAFGYITIILFIQSAMGYTSYGIDWLLDAAGIKLFEPDLGSDLSAKSIILSFVYSVIIAPVTEELLMRGFVQKNLSRVGQHFGIITTALLFGVWHENVAQFLLAFMGGLFFGYIAAKHDSLVPSIICHMAVNLVAEVFSLCSDFGWTTAETVLDLVYFLLCLIGLVLLIRMLIVERFPHTMPHQVERGIRQALASPLLIAVFVCHTAIAILLIVSAN